MIQIADTMDPARPPEVRTERDLPDDELVRLVLEGDRTTRQEAQAELRRRRRKRP